MNRSAAPTSVDVAKVALQILKQDVALTVRKDPQLTFDHGKVVFFEQHHTASGFDSESVYRVNPDGSGLLQLETQVVDSPPHTGLFSIPLRVAPNAFNSPGGGGADFALEVTVSPTGPTVIFTYNGCGVASGVAKANGLDLLGSYSPDGTKMSSM